MEAEIHPPRERTCELCGRQDVWDASVGNWVIATDDDGDRQVGNKHCIHEWDINGRYNPVAGGTEEADTGGQGAGAEDADGDG